MSTFKRTLAMVLLALVPISVTMAQGNSAKNGKKKARERNIVREAKVSKDHRHVDFDAVDIDGQPRTPLGTQVSTVSSDKNHDLIKLRTNWHPEMVQSAASIETGR